MRKDKRSLRGESPDKQPRRRAAPALAGEPLRDASGGQLPESVRGRVPRRRPGRGSGVSPVEARAIQRFYLTAPTISQEALAERFGRSRDTIRRVLHDPSFEALKAEFDQTNAIEARAVLSTGRTPAAQAWLASLERAAQRGDHRPSRDLLYVTRTVDPPSQQGGGPQVIVSIGQIVTGCPANPSLLPDVQWRDDTPGDDK